MLSFFYKKGPFKIWERIGKQKGSLEPPGKADIQLEMRLLPTVDELEITKQKNSAYLLTPSFIVSLEDNEEEIFNRLHRTTKYEIKRAIKKDRLNFIEVLSPTDQEIEEFRSYFDSFAIRLGIEKCKTDRLKAIRDQAALVISSMHNPEGDVLCSTAYLMDGEQAYGLYSATSRYSFDNSKHRNLIGRANRYLHWKNIMNAKERGLNWYNFGGKITNSDVQGQNVNKFKQSFGARLGYDLRIYTSKSFIGKLFKLLWYWKWRKTPEYSLTKKVIKH